MKARVSSFLTIYIPKRKAPTQHVTQCVESGDLCSVQWRGRVPGLRLRPGPGL